jgi:hypothetical protein
MDVMTERLELAQKLHLHKNLTVPEIEKLLRCHDEKVWEAACQNQRLVLSYLLKNEKEAILSAHSPEVTI